MCRAGPSYRRKRHHGPVVVAGKPRRDVEPVDVGQLNIEQHDLGLEAAGLRERGRAVGGLAHHVEALRFEEDSRSCAERRMVVHDQDPVTHVHKSGFGAAALQYGWPYPAV